MGNRTRTGYGFHYFPDELHYRAKDLEAWKDEFSQLGISWLTLRGSMARAIPEAFIRGVQELGIKPIIHIPAPIGVPDLTAVDSLVKTYARWDVENVVFYDRPNQRTSWQPGMFARTKVVDRFLDLWIPVADIMLRRGLRPILPPLEQGGTYWDTAFLDMALMRLNQRKKYDITNALMLGIYAHAFDKPINWGQGGQAKWKDSRPYNTPEGSQDQLGFRSFEWYHEIIQSRLNEDVPMLMIAGGVTETKDTVPTNQSDLAGWHGSCNKEVIDALTKVEDELPSYLQNVNFWLLSANPNTPEHDEGWYRADGSINPCVAELKTLAQKRKKVLTREKSVSRHQRNTTRPDASKPIYHYLLLPTFEWGPAKWHWDIVHEYVNAFQPTVGYTQHDARLAQFVTIVGNGQGVSNDIESELKRCGCVVERITGAGGDDLRAQFDRLVTENTRFRTIQHQ